MLYRFGHTIGHLTVGEFTVTGVPLFLFAFLVRSSEMDGKAERRWLGTSPCDNERTTRYCIEDKRTPGLRGEVLGADTTGPAVASRYNSIELGMCCLLPRRDLLDFRRPESSVLLLLVWDTS